MSLTWTKPYCGVSHLNAGGPHQYTVEQYENFTVATMFPLRRIAGSQERTFPTVEEAKHWLERKAVEA